MMTQILIAGGIEPYTDGRRVADADNPRGYFEHEQVTRLASDSSWLPEVRGKVVKVVAPLLSYLTDDEQYAVVFLHRDLTEVVASQRAMLDRMGRTGAALDGDSLAEALRQQVEQVRRWCAAREHVRVLHLNYAEVLENPHETCQQIADFLCRPLDITAMQAAIDPSLRRQGRKSKVGDGLS